MENTSRTIVVVTSRPAAIHICRLSFPTSQYLTSEATKKFFFEIPANSSNVETILPKKGYRKT